MTLAMQVVPINDALAKLLSQSIPVLMVVFLRTFMQSVFLIAFDLMQGKNLVKQQTLMDKRQFIRGFFWWSATYLFFISIKDHDIPGALALFFTGPIFIALVAPLVLKEKFDYHYLVATIIGFVGIIFIVRPSSDQLQLGILLSFIAGLLYGCYIIATRFIAIDKNFKASQIAFGASFWASLFGLPLALFAWQNFEPKLWYIVLGMGFSSAIGHILIAKACQKADANTLAPFHYTEMFGAIIASYIIFNTLPVAGVWIGILLIVVSGAWAMIVTNQKTIDTGL